MKDSDRFEMPPGTAVDFELRYGGDSDARGRRRVQMKKGDLVRYWAPCRCFPVTRGGSPCNRDHRVVTNWVGVVESIRTPSFNTPRSHVWVRWCGPTEATSIRSNLDQWKPGARGIESVEVQLLEVISEAR